MPSGQCFSYGQTGDAMLLSRSRERRFLLIVPALAVCLRQRSGATITRASNLAAVRYLLQSYLRAGSNGRSNHGVNARRPIQRGVQGATTERKAGSFNVNVVPLPPATRVSVPPFRSASSRAMARP